MLGNDYRRRNPSKTLEHGLTLGRPCIVGWGNAQSDPGFGASNDATSVKAKMVNLIASVRTLMRSESDLSARSQVMERLIKIQYL